MAIKVLINIPNTIISSFFFSFSFVLVTPFINKADTERDLLNFHYISSYASFNISNVVAEPIIVLQISASAAKIVAVNPNR